MNYAPPVRPFASREASTMVEDDGDDERTQAVEGPVSSVGISVVVTNGSYDKDLGGNKIPQPRSSYCPER